MEFTNKCHEIPKCIRGLKINVTGFTNVIPDSHINMNTFK